MRSMRGGRGGACLGALLWLVGCAGGDNTDTGFGTPFMPTMSGTSAGTSTGEPPLTTEPDTTNASATSGTTTPGTTTDDPTGEDTMSTGTTDTGTTGTGTTDDSSTGGPPVCGNGVVDPLEECDDGNTDETDACLNNCVAAKCGDGLVHAGIEECDDGNAEETDACLSSCVAAKCGDGIVQAGVEACDDGVNDGAYNGCAVGCATLGPRCGDGVINGNFGETCDDGNVNAGDGCDGQCKAECANQGGGNLVAENGTGMNKFYCYNAGDSAQVRALKACESHFGVGQCCVITNGYQDKQYGLCGGGGGAGTVHFHYDNHPDGHCAPFYVVGDVVSPGWCGTVIGNLLD